MFRTVSCKAKLTLGLINCIILGFLSSGCKLNSNDVENLNQAFTPVIDPPVSTLPVDEPEGACYAERFRQPEAEIIKKIDILFVRDTSGSLDDEASAIGSGIQAFVNELPRDVDYQVGVMFAHGSTSAYSGALYQYGTEPAVLSSQQMSLTDIQNHLKNKLSKIKTDSSSDGGEEGLFSMTRALEPENLAKSRAKGFFRPDAGLAVVFIADENDICAKFPAGITPVPDPDKLEIPAFKRDCGSVTPESTLAKLKTLQAGRPLLVSGIVYNNLQTLPKVGENELGYGYLDIIMLANGIAIDLADGHYDMGLRQIGSLATIKLNLQTEFKLAHDNVVVDSIAVQVDNQEVPFKFLSEQNEVQIFEAGGQLSTVDIRYCQKIVSDPGEPGGNDGGSGGTGGGSGGDAGSGVPPYVGPYPSIPRDLDGDGYEDATGEPIY